MFIFDWFKTKKFYNIQEQILNLIILNIMSLVNKLKPLAGKII